MKKAFPKKTGRGRRSRRRYSAAILTLIFVKQGIVDEINERKSTSKKATETKKATNQKKKSIKAGKGMSGGIENTRLESDS